MANVVRVFVENPDELLNAGMFGAGAIIRLQSAAAEAGPFSNETTEPLVAGVRSYTLFDSDGLSTTWYRSRFENSGGTNVSEWSDPFLAAGDGILSLEDAKQRLEIDADDTEQDENIAEWIGQITSFMRSFTGRRLTPDPATEYILDGYAAMRHGTLLRFPNGIQSLSELALAAWTGEAFEVIPATDYFLRPVEALREAGWPATELWMSDNPSADNPHAVIPPGYANVRLRGAFSWEATPPELEAVAGNLLVATARLGGSSGGEEVTVNIDGERTFSRALSMEDWRTLKRYRVPRTR